MATSTIFPSIIIYIITISVTITFNAIATSTIISSEHSQQQHHRRYHWHHHVHHLTIINVSNAILTLTVPLVLAIFMTTIDVTMDTTLIFIITTVTIIFYTILTITTISSTNITFSNTINAIYTTVNITIAISIFTFTVIIARLAGVTVSITFARCRVFQCALLKSLLWLFELSSHATHVTN